MPYNPPTYNNPAFNNPVRQAPGSDYTEPNCAGKRCHTDAERHAAMVKRLRQLWYFDHPLCGNVLGCNRACPHYAQVPKYGQLFPNCKHPDSGSSRYKP